MSIRYLIGDVFDKISELETDSVDLILTSPPFLALRSYLPADHPDKHKEIGSEATPTEYVDVLLRLSVEWRRLLAPHGSLVVELGDTYSGSGGAGGDYDPGGFRDGQPGFRGSGRTPAGRIVDTNEKYERVRGEGYRRGLPNLNQKKQGGGPGWPLAKSLTLIPESYRFALAYGINPHTGTPSPAGQWRVRNVVRWVRPNPPVGALGDKFRPATSELVVACTSKTRWFDLDAVREPSDYHRDSLYVNKDTPPGQRPNMSQHTVNSAGAPPLDWWKISPKGYSGAHYAVFPSELCVKPIKAMCPREVCRTCGQPRRRITNVSYEAHGNPVQQHREDTASADYPLQQRNQNTQGMEFGRATKTVDTLGWSDCGHDDYRAGLVLDPFAGTGTTLAVAHGHSRDAIGIDIDSRNAELARDRVGPLFLEVR